MQKESLQNEEVTPTPSRRFGARFSRKGRWSILAIALLSVGALGAAGLNLVMPRLPNRAQTFRERAAWYVNHGQLKADAHTVVSALGYFVSRESELPATTVPTNLPVAGTVTARPGGS